MTVLLLLMVLLAGCAPSGPVPVTPSPDRGMLLTQGAQTVMAGLPSQTAAPTGTMTPTVTATQTPGLVIMTVTPATPYPTRTPDYPQGFIQREDNIMDQAYAAEVDTYHVRPSEEFKASWMLNNIGRRDWTDEYHLSYSGGGVRAEYMWNYLPQEVPPGTQLEMSINMIAPGKPGRYYSEWVLKNADLFWFYRLFAVVEVSE